MRATRVSSSRRPAAPAPVPAARHNRVLRAADQRALDLEARLVDLIVPVLERAGEVAAANFEARVTHARTASGLRQTFPLIASAASSASTMVALKPTPTQAEMLAEPDGDPPDHLHVTLADLGETEGDLSEVADALAGIPGAHGPLEGQVGGVGCFADNGKGHPAILIPSVPGLAELRQHVAEALTRAGIDYGRSYGFVPHMTTGYRPGGPQAPPIDRAGQPLSFGDLWVVRGDTETIQLPLTGVLPVTACGACLGTGMELAAYASYDDPHCRACLGAGTTAAAEPDLATLEAIAEVAQRYEPDPPDGYGDAWWSEADRAVYWICADWSSSEEIDGATEAFLEIDGVEQVDACDECPAPKGGDWVLAYKSGAGDASLQAASPPGEPPFCLPSGLRGRTDPVRRAVVDSVMKAGLDGAGISYDVTNPLAGKVLSQSGSQIKAISKTTQLDVMKTIRHAYEEGLSVPDTATAIRAAMKESAPARARLIARTELAGAVNGASLAATQIVDQATGAGYSKIWLTAPGAPYPRHEDYQGLDGQTRGLDEPFDVGGYDLMFPGDPDGPPEEICNCRCALAYSDEGDHDAESGADGMEASARPPCLHATILSPEGFALEMSGVMARFADGPGPGWIPPAPEEVLSTECEGFVQPLPVSTPMPEPARLAPDTISVGAGPPLPPEMVARIRELGLDRWPPARGEATFRVLGDAKDTEALYYDKGTKTWADERAPIHQTIVDEHFAGKVAPAEGDPRHAYFTAGGGASGKSGLRFDLAGAEVDTDTLAERADTILVDPDRIKAMLPEFREIRDAGDAYAASAVHEESSAIAKMVVREAQDRGYNVVLDTTGSSDGFLGKVEQFKEKGYETQVSMVSVPTNEAIVRAMARGDKSGRYLAISALKGAHRGASEQAARWMGSRAVDRWSLYDNSGARAEVVATGGAGREASVTDRGKLDEILAKASEPDPNQVDVGALGQIKDGPPLPALDSIPISDDAYIASLQTEQRRLGKQVAAARYQLKAEGDTGRRRVLEERMAVWEKRRAELRELERTPDPKAELRRLTKQIAAARFDIRNGRGSERLEARLRSLEARREQVREVLGGSSRAEIDQEAVARDQKIVAEPQRAAVSDERIKAAGELVDADTRTASSVTWAREKVLKDGPDGYFRLPAQKFISGGDYEMAESVVLVDEGGSGVVIRAELRPGEDAATAARFAQNQFTTVYATQPEWMTGKLEHFVLARGSNPGDAYWQKTYKNFDHAAATGGQGRITFWRENLPAHTPTTFDHEMGHIVGKHGGPHQQTPWLAAQKSDAVTGAEAMGLTGPRQGFGSGREFIVGGRAVSSYGANSPSEDWAESIRLYLADHRNGSIGTMQKGNGFTTPVRFADVYPARAKLIERWLRGKRRA